MAETALSKKQLGSGIWTEDSLIAGNNISITQVEKPVIDGNTLVLCHFDDSKTDEISGSAISTPLYTTTYVGGKFANGITGSDKNARLQFREYSTKLTGNYTIDLWVYPIAAMEYMSFYDASGVDYRFKLSENSFSLGAYVTGTGTAITDAAYPSGVSFGLNTWHHIAYVNDNNNNKVYFFLDGKAIHNATRTLTDAGIYRVEYRTTVNQGLRIDELRVSNVARWTSDFTPYSQPYAAAGATQYQINNTQDISSKQDAISDLATIRSGAAAGATAVQPGDLATVATSGAYSDLSGTPTIPTVDQTYSAASANAQSGVAVASAITTKANTDLSNVSATGKDTAIGWGMPDYDSGITIVLQTTGVTYTPSFPGVIRVYRANNDGQHYIRVYKGTSSSGIILQEYSGASQFNTGYSYAYIPVSAGETYFIICNTLNIVNAVFFPFKGAN